MAAHGIFPEAWFVTLYAQLVAQRDANEANQRIMDLTIPPRLSEPERRVIEAARERYACAMRVKAELA